MMCIANRVGSAFLLLLAISIVSGSACAERVHFSGRVVDNEQNSIQDAYLFLYEITYVPDSIEVNRRLVAQTVSDSEGTFVFSTDKPTGQGYTYAVVLATTVRHGMRWIPWTRYRDEQAVLQFGDYTRLSGVVQDVEGRPVPDVTVRAVLRLPSEKRETESYSFDWLTQTTDASGRFTFHFIPTDAVALFSIEQSTDLAGRGLVPGVQNLQFPYTAGDVSIVLTVYEESRISGVCVDADERPVTGIELILAGAAPFGQSHTSATTDAEGHFTFTAPGGGFYSILLSPSSTNTGWASEPCSVLVGKGQERTEVVFRVSKTAMVDLHAVDVQTGQTVDNAVVFITRKSDESVFDSLWYGRRVHLGQGRQRLELPEGVYDYTVEAAGYSSVIRPEPLIVQSGTSVILSTELTPLPVLRGVIRDAAGNGVPGMQLAVLPNGGTAATDQNGGFEITYQPGETEGYLWAIRREKTPHLGVLHPLRDVPESLTVQANNTALVTGQVFNSAGDPITNAHLSIYLETASGPIYLPTPGLLTNADGIFSTAVAAGFRYRLMVPQDRYLSAGRTINVPQDAAELRIEPIRVGLTTVTGRIVDEQSRPIKGADVLVYDAVKDRTFVSGYRLGLMGRTISDATGRFEMERRNPDQDADHSMIVAIGQDYALGVRNISGHELQVDPIVLESRPKGFSGTVIDSSGRPISGATVAAYVSSYTAAERYYNTNTPAKLAQTEWLRSQTDAEGRFYISGVPRFAKAEFSIEANGYETLFTWDTGRGLNKMTISAGIDNLDFVLYRIGTLRGRVLQHFTAAPLVGEKVFVTPRTDSQPVIVWNAFSGTRVLSRPEGTTHEIITDSEGMFTVAHLRPGRYRVGLDPFSSPSRRWTAEPLDIEIVEGQSAAIVLSAVPVGTVEVRVVEKNTQNPVVGAAVRLTAKDASPHPTGGGHVQSIRFLPPGSGGQEDIVTLFSSGAERETIIPVRSNAAGLATFYVAPGEYRIASIVRPAYQAAANERIFRVDSGQTTRIHAEMHTLPESLTPTPTSTQPPAIPEVPSPEPVVRHTPLIEESDSDTCTLNVLLVNEATQEQIDDDNIRVSVKFPDGGVLWVKRNDQGYYRARLRPGPCQISVNGYPHYHYVNGIDTMILPEQDNEVVVSLYKYPIIEGIIRLPESVGPDDLVADIQPDGLLSIRSDSFKVAGDGEFSFVITPQPFPGQRRPLHGWLWIRTKDYRFTSLTQVPMEDVWLEISLKPEASVLFKKPPRHSSIWTWAYSQPEYKNLSTRSINHVLDNQLLIDNDAYFGIRGLLGGQSDLTYEVLVGHLARSVTIRSADLIPGQETIIELPSN